MIALSTPKTNRLSAGSVTGSWFGAQMHDGSMDDVFVRIPAKCAARRGVSQARESASLRVASAGTRPRTARPVPVRKEGLNVYF
ncbi:MAG: hypothetical protein ACOX0U_07075 [Oscillospiraceae bacterium]